MRPKVVVTNWIHAEVGAYLGAHAEVIANRSRETPFTADQIVEAGEDATALLAFMTDRVDDALLARLPALRIVACALKGFDNFDVEACTRRGVWITIVPDLLTVPTAELAVGLTISLARNVLEGDAYIRAGRFQGWRPMLYGTGLAGSTVGVVGMGAVGQAVARRLQGFDLRLLCHDPRLAPGDRVEGDVTACGLDDLLAECDFVILAAPLSAESADLIDAAALARMKRGVYLINPARGSLVDEEAVADALASGQLAGYAADAFEMEDWARPGRRRAIPERLLLDRERTLLTPHIGSGVDRIRREITLEAARNIVQVLNGERPDGAINDPTALAPAAVS